MEFLQEPAKQTPTYEAPQVPAWLKKIVAPWVALTALYQAFFDRCFVIFYWLAKPLFWAASALDWMARNPGAVLATIFVALLIFITKVISVAGHSYGVL